MGRSNRQIFQVPPKLEVSPEHIAGKVPPKLGTPKHSGNQFVTPGKSHPLLGQKEKLSSIKHVQNERFLTVWIMDQRIGMVKGLITYPENNSLVSLQTDYTKTKQFLPFNRLTHIWTNRFINFSKKLIIVSDGFGLQFLKVQSVIQSFWQSIPTFWKFQT